LLETSRLGVCAFFFRSEQIASLAGDSRIAMRRHAVSRPENGMARALLKWCVAESGLDHSRFGEPVTFLR
jgi:hypothetical protein